MKALMDFTFKLGARISLSVDFTVEKAGRYFLLNKNLKGLIRRDFYYAGTYLGKVKNGIFFPSFNLLAMLAKGRANKIVVDKKAAWLFICGRDVFRRGVLTVHGSRRKGDYALVMNEFGECLGFGKILCSLDADVKRTEVVVKNISDVGDFLRREI
jgi:ribosome biogenesis protein Nip4